MKQIYNINQEVKWNGQTRIITNVVVYVENILYELDSEYHVTQNELMRGGCTGHE